MAVPISPVHPHIPALGMEQQWLQEPDCQMKIWNLCSFIRQVQLKFTNKNILVSNLLYFIVKMMFSIMILYENIPSTPCFIAVIKWKLFRVSIVFIVAENKFRVETWLKECQRTCSHNESLRKV